jgi:hypothetical protein
MKFLAASVPRSVRSARLSHLRTDAILGSWYIQNPGGGIQVFDVVMQAEVDFVRTKNQLASPAMGASLQQGQASAPYVLKDIKQLDLPDGTDNPTQVAAAHFRLEFKLPAA